MAVWRWPTTYLPRSETTISDFSSCVCRTYAEWRIVTDTNVVAIGMLLTLPLLLPVI